MLSLMKKIKAEKPMLMADAAFFLEMGDSKEDIVDFLVEFLDEKFEFKKDVKGQILEMLSDVVIRHIVAPSVEAMMDPEKRRKFLESMRSLH